MNFSELETLMSSRGVTTLAEIARTLNTTPQAVSNWKSRNQVPHHVVAKLNQFLPPSAGSPQTSDQPPFYSASVNDYKSPSVFEEDMISVSDILLTLAEQLKVIVLTTFITVFLTFIYVQFIQQPQYISWATVLVPSNSGGNIGGIAGLASQFGMNIPSGSQADLSSPSLFPELIRSRTFAEKILDKKFYTKKFDRELSLLAILTHGEGPPKVGKDTLVTQALSSLNAIIKYDQVPSSSFSMIKVTAFEPVFAKELAEEVLLEIEDLNRFYKSQTVNEKTSFISNRIASVENDLESSETSLKEFKEKNRQISSPALELEQDRLGREVEIQKAIYLTLKQQLELAKIEEIRGASIVQVLDSPQTALGPSNKNLKPNVLLAGIVGFGLGIMLGFVRSYLNNNDKKERKKLRRTKYFFKKKIKDLFTDHRIAGIIGGFLLIGLPFFLGTKSPNPVFFGIYSAKLMIVNTIYVITLLFCMGLFIHDRKKGVN